MQALGPGDRDGALEVFAAAALRGPIAEEHRPAAAAHGDRPLGAFHGRQMVGTASSFATTTAVPGGAAVATAGVVRVGVRPDRTRRGVLTALMRHQVADLAATGVVLASLRASEAGIYGRFGYGVATRSRTVRVRGGAQWRAGAPVGGPVRVLDRGGVLPALAALHDRIGLRHPGGIARPASWWALNTGRRSDDGDDLLAAVHTGPDGDDGFVVVSREDGSRGPAPALLVRDLHARGVEASAALWRFVLGGDRAGPVVGRRRPLDEPLELLLADPRGCAVTAVEDETWLRILDVPSALAVRRFAPAEPVLLDVRDGQLPANSGTYRIAGGTAQRVRGDVPAADLSCDVAGLAMAYLGDRAPSELVAAGWWSASGAAVLARADAAFATPVRPWCGTYF